MNLDKLKELEGKASAGKTGEWGDYLNVVNYMWDNRKEMIETIERYKAVLEWIGSRAKEYSDQYRAMVKKEGDVEDLTNIEFRALARAAKKALEDPEKDSQPNGEDQPTN